MRWKAIFTLIVSFFSRVSCTWMASVAWRKARRWNSPSRSPPRALSHKKSLARVVSTAWAVRGDPKARKSKSDAQRETGKRQKWRCNNTRIRSKCLEQEIMDAAKSCPTIQLGPNVQQDSLPISLPPPGYQPPPLATKGSQQQAWRVTRINNCLNLLAPGGFTPTKSLIRPCLMGNLSPPQNICISQISICYFTINILQFSKKNIPHFAIACSKSKKRVHSAF